MSKSSHYWWSKVVAGFCLIGVSVFIAALTQTAQAQSLSVELTLPKLDVDPYHRPYVAVWLETEQREPVQTLAVWYEQVDWLKDLRQWWRKLGRNQVGDMDGFSSATRKPGTYTLNWQGKELANGDIKPGKYLLNIEVSREEGGRSYLRQPITWGQQDEFTVEKKAELGVVIVRIKP